MRNEREARWQAKLQKEDRLLPGASELKVTTTNRMSFKAFAEHQLNNLARTRRSKWTYKIQDVGKAKKPFDCITFDRMPAWCVCIFDGTGGVYAIDILDFCSEIKKSTMRSITEERAREIGIRL